MHSTTFNSKLTKPHTIEISQVTYIVLKQHHHHHNHNIHTLSYPPPMAPSYLKQKSNQPKPTSTSPQRALKSLTLSILIPFTLTFTSIYLFGSEKSKYNSIATSLYFPPLWLIHFAQLISSSLMGFAAWFVWVDGGLKIRSDAWALYASHVALCVTWDPLVLRLNVVFVGFLFCVVNFGTVVGLHNEFRKVNLVAGEIVRPCMAWMAMLTLLTFKMIDVSKVVDLSEMRLYD